LTALTGILRGIRVARRPGVNRFGWRLWLAAPVACAYAVLLAYPLYLTAKMSFEDGTASYGDVLSDPLFWPAVRNTLVITLLTTVITVVLAYVCAAALWKAKPLGRLVIAGFVLLPFWTGILVKNMAWTVLLQDSGVVNDVLDWLGFGRLELLRHEPAVVIGMVHYLLPYAVLPIFAALNAIDDQLERAAVSLGASRSAVFRIVILPLSLPGVYAATLLVAIICTGFFITPVLLGSPSNSMVANLIDYYARTQVEFGRASALAVMVSLVVTLLVVVYQRLPKEGQYAG
jgi:ABC-type spermidine/putrescine transport system permease subunit I